MFGQKRGHFEVHMDGNGYVWRDGRVGGWMGGWMDGWADGWVDGWMCLVNGRTDKMDGWMDGWMTDTCKMNGCAKYVVKTITKKAEDTHLFLPVYLNAVRVQVLLFL